MSEIKTFAMQIANLIDDKKGYDIKVLDVRHLSSIADYFVIASGTSSRHVESLAENVKESLSKKGIEVANIEGKKNAGWVILDYRDVIAHVFQGDDRAFYGLERMWNDAVEVKLSFEDFV